MINYNLISQALTYYKNLGFIEIETPWFTSEQATYSTIPNEINVFTIGSDRPNNPDRLKNNIGYLVGSAEQGLVQLMLDNKLKDNELYVSAGPCFRNEAVLDTYHLQTFFKVELMCYYGNNIHDKGLIENAVNHMTNTAFDCLYEFVKNSDNIIRKVKTEIGFDIEINGIEVGSYGYRAFRNHNWIYGTGIAEPRFSLATQNIVDKK